jgi:quinol monooxygenase YgiN
VSGVGRYVKMPARPGQGAALAEAMLQVAASLTDTPGCQLYVINRAATEPDTVWVTELWVSQQAVDASLAALRTEAGRARLADITGLLAGPPERIDLEPVGGVGLSCSD